VADVAGDVAVRTSSFPEDSLRAAHEGLGPRLRKLATLARQNPLGTFGFVVIVVFVVVAVFAPIIAPYDPKELVASRDQPLSADYWFGTERLGRDIFSRVVYGSRISLSVAVISVLLGGSIGILLGVLSGYMGGFIDASLQRTVDAAIAFPALLLLLIITQSLGPSYWTIVFALMLAVIPGVTRVVRGAVLSEKNNQYVEAARASGAWAPRILLRHILPNVVALGIIVMTTLLGGIILAESALSFLGLGIPGATSWGQDVSKARESVPYHLPAAIFPGAAITLTVLGFNLLGDAIRDIADPRLRGSR
jgi:peptide/nickel transport system permease protein